MTADALNRLGIALNVVAGLLLAPQLVGEARIERAERWAGHRADSVQRRASVVADHLQPLWPMGPSPAPVSRVVYGVLQATYWFARGLEAAMRFASTQISQHDAVLGLMTFTGVILFLAGNSLQFAATY